MTDLRSLSPIAYTPAILPFHKLVFNVPGMPFVEPSFASVEPTSSGYNKNDKNDFFPDNGNETDSVVHGILYKLSEQDFLKVCQSEGVPFSYRLHRCE